jgi:uncharacterized phage protein (TIGR01671 family)
MMRYKFRAWTGNEMLENVIPVNDSAVITDMQGFPPTATVAYRHDIKSIMEYCGRKDKDGNEIYESDVVGILMDRLGSSYPHFKENDYCVCEIIFEDGGFHAINNEREYQFPLWALAPGAFIRLGDVHQNPELLK